jgi:hypothetical protein
MRQRSRYRLAKLVTTRGRWSPRLGATLPGDQLLAGPGLLDHRAAAGGIGHGIYEGTAPITIGSHVIEPITGKRGTVEQIIAPQKLVIRLEDGTLAQAEAPR